MEKKVIATPRVIYMMTVMFLMTVRTSLKLMLISTMMMNIVIIQDFWTCKRIAFTIFLVWQGVLGFFAVYGIFYVAGFFC